MSVKEYFEAIAGEHRMVQHSDAEPHFASSLDEAATLEARRLHYPAIFLQGGDFQVIGTEGNYMTSEEYRLVVATHVKDTGNEVEKDEAFKMTKMILRDILARMIRDKRKLVKPMIRFDVAGTQVIRVENVDDGLYGWLVILSLTEGLTTLNCNENLNS